MKTIISFIFAAIATSVFAVQPQTKYSGVTYEVDIARAEGTLTKGCITFHESGRFTMSNDSLTMLWSPQIDFPNQFLAVTAPGARSVVPYHQGVYGEVLADNTVKGRSIDQGGNKFWFHGRPKNDCDASRTERMAPNANQLATGARKVPVDLLPVINPCWLPPGQHAPCDPIPDPMRASIPVLDGPIRISDPCQLSDGSWTPCDPVPDPTRAAKPIFDGPIHISDPCQLADDSWSPCDPIPDPTRAANPIVDGPIRISDPCQLTDGSWTPCDPVPDPTRAANPIVDGPIRISDPCQLADGSWTHCDPVPDPLRGDVENVEPDALEGRSFRLTLGTSDRGVLEYCWTFTSKHKIEYAKLGLKGSLSWSPDYNQSYNAGFISAGAGTDGQGMAYHGTLVGDNLLEVVGIEARDYKSLVTYGFGQEVASCK